MTAQKKQLKALYPSTPRKKQEAALLPPGIQLLPPDEQEGEGPVDHTPDQDDLLTGMRFPASFARALMTEKQRAPMAAN